MYEAGGDVQIVPKRSEPAGEGSWMRAGIAEEEAGGGRAVVEERKRLLPSLPQHVGVVIAADGSGDPRHPAGAGPPLCESPCGDRARAGCRAGAAEEIAEAIGRLNALGGLDALIVGRGGGSLEDLWCFNEEVVVWPLCARRSP